MTAKRLSESLPPLRLVVHPVYTLFKIYKDRIESWASILGLKNTKDKEKQYSIYRSWNNFIKILRYVGFSRKLWKIFFRNFKLNKMSLFCILNLVIREVFAYRAEIMYLGKLYNDLKFQLSEIKPLIMIMWILLYILSCQVWKEKTHYFETKKYYLNIIFHKPPFLNILCSVGYCVYLLNCWVGMTMLNARHPIMFCFKYICSLPPTHPPQPRPKIQYFFFLDTLQNNKTHANEFLCMYILNSGDMGIIPVLSLPKYPPKHTNFSTWICFLKKISTNTIPVFPELFKSCPATKANTDAGKLTFINVWRNIELSAKTYVCLHRRHEYMNIIKLLTL